MFLTYFIFKISKLTQIWSINQKATTTTIYSKSKNYFLFHLGPVLLKHHTSRHSMHCYLTMKNFIHVSYFRKFVYKIFLNITEKYLIRIDKWKEVTAHVYYETKKNLKKGGFACTVVSNPQNAVWQRTTSLGFVDYLAKIFDQL